MSKRKKAVLAVGLVLAAFLIGAIIFYMHFIMNAGQTIETLQKLVAGNGYEITADCAMTFEPSDQLKPVTDLAQELLNTDSLTAKFTATGDSAQKNLKLQLKENITEVCDQLGYDFNEISKTFEPLCTAVKGIETAEEFEEESESETETEEESTEAQEK